MMTACSEYPSQFIGVWHNPNHPDEILELRKDGTFHSSNGREELNGYWNNYKQGHITLTIASDKDGNLLDASIDEHKNQLVINIAGNQVLMQKMTNQ
jgi:hypothetical protein